MARVKTQTANIKTERAERTCRRCGAQILAGETYYSAAPGFRSPTIRWCYRHHPRPSELTSSGYKADMYGAQEAIEDALDSGDDWIETVKQEIEVAIEVANSTAEEYEAAAEAFGGEGPNAEAAEMCHSWASELEGLDLDPDQEPTHEGEEGQYSDERLEDIKGAIEAAVESLEL